MADEILHRRGGNPTAPYQQTIQQTFGDVSDALIANDKYHVYHVVRERHEQSVKGAAYKSRTELRDRFSFGR